MRRPAIAADKSESASENVSREREKRGTMGYHGVPWLRAAAVHSSSDNKNNNSNNSSNNADGLSTQPAISAPGERVRGCVGACRRLLRRSGSLAWGVPRVPSPQPSRPHALTPSSVPSPSPSPPPRLLMPSSPHLTSPFLVMQLMQCKPPTTPAPQHTPQRHPLSHLHAPDQGPLSPLSSRQRLGPVARPRRP
jgi:hypothetical protein